MSSTRIKTMLGRGSPAARQPAPNASSSTRSGASTRSDMAPNLAQGLQARDVGLIRPRDHGEVSEQPMPEEPRVGLHVDARSTTLTRRLLVQRAGPPGSGSIATEPKVSAARAIG